MKLKQIYLCIILCLLYASASAQNIDSLKQCLKIAKHDTSRLAILEQLAEFAPDGEWEKYNDELNIISEKNLRADPTKKIFLKYKAVYLNNMGTIYQTTGNSKKAIENFKESIRLMEKTGDEQGVANAYNNLGSVYHLIGNVSEALQYHQNSLATYRKINDKSGAATALTNIGSIYERKGDVSRALELYLESLKLQESVSDKQGIAISLNNIGIIYQRQGIYAKAVEYLTKSIKIEEEMGNIDGVGSCLINLGYIYNEHGDTTMGILYFNRGLKIFEGSGDKDGIANCLINLGFINLNRKRYDSAMVYFMKSLSIRQEIGDKHGEANCLRCIGSIYLAKDNLGKATEYGLRSYKMATELNYPLNICDAAGLLARIYKKQGKGMEALKMFEVYIAMRDTVMNEKTRKTSLKKQFQYDYDKKVAQDSLKAAVEKKVTDLQFKQERTTRYALYGGLTLILIFSGFLFKRFKVEQGQKKVIENQKH